MSSFNMNHWRIQIIKAVLKTYTEHPVETTYSLTTEAKKMKHQFCTLKASLLIWSQDKYSREKRKENKYPKMMSIIRNCFNYYFACHKGKNTFHSKNVSIKAWWELLKNGFYAVVWFIHSSFYQTYMSAA